MMSFDTFKPKLLIYTRTPSLSNALPTGLLQRLHYATNETKTEFKPLMIIWRHLFKYKVMAQAIHLFNTC